MLINEENKRENLKYNNFKEMINTFYQDFVDKPNITEKKYGKEYGQINIIPKVIIDVYKEQARVEFKIGTKKQFYKIKDIIEFYQRMNEKQYYSYGLKLEFLHEEDAFINDAKPLLHFILKYAQIMEAVRGNIRNRYGYYGVNISSSFIILGKESIDELFDILNNQYVEVESNFQGVKTLFTSNMPDIKFELEKINSIEYIIKPNINIYENYQIVEGKHYIYLLKDNRFYRCSQDFRDTTLKLLDIFKKNLTQEIKFPKQYLESLFSIVVPKMKNSIILDKVDKEEIKKYIPKKLGVKVFLDYDKLNHILMETKFCYESIEFNPFGETKNIKVARDIISETNALNIFAKTGFRLDRENKRLVLVEEEKIYDFLTNDIDLYSNKFEVLVTENFKTKEIKEPKIRNYWS